MKPRLLVVTVLVLSVLAACGKDAPEPAASGDPTTTTSEDTPTTSAPVAEETTVEVAGSEYSYSIEGSGEPMWVGIDPTNRCLAGERYVKIGHGRHYRDVPPIKGVYRGTAGSELSASVRMTRSDVTPSRA